MARSPYCARPFCVCTIEGGTCQAVEREDKYFRQMWPNHLTAERAECTILGMSNHTYLKPSQLVPGHMVRSGSAGYTVLSEPSEQPDGTIVVVIQYLDGGRGQRTFDADDYSVPVNNA